MTGPGHPKENKTRTYAYVKLHFNSSAAPVLLPYTGAGKGRQMSGGDEEA
jgi:hypothetical protein